MVPSPETAAKRCSYQKSVRESKDEIGNSKCFSSEEMTLGIEVDTAEQVPENRGKQHELDYPCRIVVYSSPELEGAVDSFFLGINSLVSSAGVASKQKHHLYRNPGCNHEPRRDAKVHGDSDGSQLGHDGCHGCNAHYVGDKLASR